MEQKTKKGILDTPYQYVGTYINEINLSKLQDSKIEKLKISFDGYMFDEIKFNFIFGVKIGLDFYDSKDNSILFVSGFRINGEEEINELKRLQTEDDNVRNAILEKWLPILMRTIYPFIRERIYQLTIDCSKPVMLPIMDMSLITSINDTIELNTEE